MLAQDYSRFAEIVAQCLEAHIRRVSSPFPLFVVLLTSWVSQLKLVVFALSNALVAPLYHVL